MESKVVFLLPGHHEQPRRAASRAALRHALEGGVGGLHVEAENDHSEAHQKGPKTGRGAKPGDPLASGRSGGWGRQFQLGARGECRLMYPTEASGGRWCVCLGRPPLSFCRFAAF